MKNTIAVLLLGACFSFAQTNTVGFSKFFTELKSASGEVLMTNAHFQSVLGNRLTFKNESQLKAFGAADLDKGALAQLRFDLTELESAQEKLDEEKAVRLRHAAAAAAAKAQQDERTKEQWRADHKRKTELAEEEARQDREERMRLERLRQYYSRGSSTTTKKPTTRASGLPAKTTPARK